MKSNSTKPITLHSRQDVNAKVDLKARLCGLTCVHPDGLLDAYEVIIPFHQIKRIAAVIAQHEGVAEIAAIRQQQTGDRVEFATVEGQKGPQAADVVKL